MMISDHDFLAPLRIVAEQVFLTGAHPELLPPSVAITTDLELAMLLENTQEPPPGYLVWRDNFDAAVAPFYSTPKAREAERHIEPVADDIWQQMEPRERALKRKKVKEGLTEAEEFWLTMAYDAFEQLMLVATSRYVTRGPGDPLLEQVFAIYRAGFYPCGVDSMGQVVAFDPRALAA